MGIDSIIQELRDVNLDSIDFADNGKLPLAQKNKIDILRNNYFNILWNEKSVNYILIITQDDFSNLNLRNFNDKKTELLSLQKSNNVFLVNNELDIISCENFTKFDSSNDTHLYCKVRSNENVLFVFADRGIDVYANTDHLHAENAAYNIETTQEYEKKYTMADLDTVINNYISQHLIRQDVYSAFFVDKHTLENINPKESNLLKNKPEDMLQNNIKQYLDSKMQNNFYLESVIETTGDKPDFHTEINSSELYLFEVKWLGKSVNPQGDGFGSKYTHARAREGVNQTLRYIKEYIEDIGKSVRAGYLIVFDARLKRTTIEYEGYRFVEEDLKEYLVKFDKFDEIILENIKPR